MTPLDIAGATQAVVDRLSAAGIRATLDERNVNPPCVLVSPPVVGWRFARGDFDATFTLWCAVPNSGRDVALANLGQLVADTADALAMRVLTGVPDDLVVPSPAPPLPAYRLTLTQSIRQQPEVTPT